MFINRDDAGRQLAATLAHYQPQHPLILAIPRGGVPIGCIVAESLKTDWDIIQVRKLRSPRNSELAVGAIDESGSTYLEPCLQAEYTSAACPSAQYLAQEKATQLALMHKRRQQLSSDGQQHNPSGRIIIVVDDGLATGSTMIAALKTLRLQHPKQLIAAVPTAPANVLLKVRAYADAVYCLTTPNPFYAVGCSYQEFNEVTDLQISQLLHHPPALTH